MLLNFIVQSINLVRMLCAYNIICACTWPMGIKKTVAVVLLSYYVSPWT